MLIKDDTITAVDLNCVIIIKCKNYDKSQGFLTNSDLKYQEERRQRKVRRIQFEER